MLHVNIPNTASVLFESREEGVSGFSPKTALWVSGWKCRLNDRKSSLFTLLLFYLFRMTSNIYLRRYMKDNTSLLCNRFAPPGAHLHECLFLLLCSLWQVVDICSFGMAARQVQSHCKVGTCYLSSETQIVSGESSLHWQDAAPIFGKITRKENDDALVPTPLRSLCASM